MSDHDHPDDPEASSESPNTAIDRVTQVDLDEPCPNCGAMFGRQESDRARRRETLVEKIDGEATVRRMKDGKLTFEVQFECPECPQEFLAEDLSDGTMTTQ